MSQTLWPTAYSSGAGRKKSGQVGGLGRWYSQQYIGLPPCSISALLPLSRSGDLDCGIIKDVNMIYRFPVLARPDTAHVLDIDYVVPPLLRQLDQPRHLFGEVKLLPSEFVDQRSFWVERCLDSP